MPPFSAPSIAAMSLQSPPLFRPGSVLQFAYPTDNRVRVSTRLVRRQFVVDRVRDLQAHPLEPIRCGDRWVTRWTHNKRQHVATARVKTETWTLYDRELQDRAWLSEDGRTEWRTNLHRP